MAGASRRRAAAALLAAACSLGAIQAADICEGCWEIGGRAGAMIPSAETGMDPSLGIGAFGAFHFRPYWAVEFGLDRHPGRIENGPDETVTFFTVRGAFTFRAVRERRTRPYIFMGMGLGYDQVGTSERSVATPFGRVTARTRPDSDAGLAYVLGAGALTHLKGRLWLRYEGQWITWSTFGLGQDGLRALGTLTWRLGR